MLQQVVRNKLFVAEKQLNRKLFQFRRDINALLKGGGGKDAWQSLGDKIDVYLKGKFVPTFKIDDYLSGDGFQTGIWGGCTWLMLHVCSLNYSPDKKRGYQALLYGLKETLPCRHCRDNFKKNYTLAEKDLQKNDGLKVFDNRTSFSKFVWYLHHNVNVMLGKDLSNEPSFVQMRDQLETFRSRCLTPAEMAEHKAKKMEGGCVNPVYGAGSKARCDIRFVQRKEGDLKKVRPLSIDSNCVVCKK